jgi:molybdopterin/thiamine biosynthesis adenylyltransferase
MDNFNYEEAFSRTLGWLTPNELNILRNKRVAIAGAGGVGGIYALILARMGVGKLHIADNDTFELANFNRQFGANLDTLGKEKTNVIKEMALKINPEMEITSFAEGVHDGNRNEFLKDVDLYLDGLDFWALQERRKIFALCHKNKIYATTVAPLGFSASLLNFHPNKMSFEEYFKLDGYSEEDQSIRFLVGLAPSFLHRGALIDKSFVNFKLKKVPSTPVGVTLCAGVACTEVVKILCKRGPVVFAPTSIQYDAWSYKQKKCYRPWGNSNPLSFITFKIIKNLIIEN